MRGIASAELRGSEPDQNIAPHGIGCEIDTEEVERLREPAHGFVGCQREQRVLTGSSGIVACLGYMNRRGRRRPMVREFADVVANVGSAHLFERFGNATVQATAACR